MGSFRKGARVTSIDKLKRGDLLVVVSHQFRAVNIIKVLAVRPRIHSGTKVRHDVINAIFVSPTNPRKRRMGTDNMRSFWDHDFEKDRTWNHFFRAVRKIKRTA